MKKEVEVSALSQLANHARRFDTLSAHIHSLESTGLILKLGKLIFLACNNERSTMIVDCKIAAPH